MRIRKPHHPAPPPPDQRAAQEAARLAERNGKAFRAVREERDEARAKIRYLQRTLSEYRERVAELEDLRERVRRTEDMVLSERARYGELMQSHQGLASSVDQKKKIIDMLEEEHGEIVARLETQLRAYKEGARVERENNIELTNRIRRLTEERDQARETLQSVAQHRDRIADDSDRVGADLQRAEQKIEILTKDRDTWKQKAENMEQAPVPTPTSEKALVRKIVKSLRKHYHQHAADHVEQEFLA